jgi:AcrR family transcriptional regulator
MSRRSEATRERILRAARALLIERGYHGVGMAEIARAAGVSRQAVYLHFGSKADLFVAMVDHGDREAGLADVLRESMAGRAPAEQLLALPVVQAYMGPRNRDLVRVLYAARAEDPAAEAAWQNRMEARHQAARQIMQDLADAGMLGEGWTVDEAADLVWALISNHIYLYLTERGWTEERYVRHMQTVLRRTFLLSPEQ